MNKKGQIFLPLVTIGLLVLLSTFLFLKFTYKENAENSFDIGYLQSSVINNYLESEKIFFYYEKVLEYNEYKSIKEFSENGGKCNKWKFNTDCEPNFKEYFKELLEKNLGDKYQSIIIDTDIEVHFTDFNFPTGSNKAEVVYEGPITIKKQPLINFQKLETIKSCIKDNIKKITKCNPKSNIGSIYIFKEEIAEILNEKLEPEAIYLEFKIDTKNSGLPTIF